MWLHPLEIISGWCPVSHVPDLMHKHENITDDRNEALTKWWWGRGEQQENSRFPSKISNASPLPRYLHSLQQLEEWRRKSFPSKTCPGNSRILKGVTFDNEVLWRMGWGRVWLTKVSWLQSIIFILAWKLSCVQGRVLQKDIIQVKRLKERLAANCSYSHHYPGDCISCSQLQHAELPQ